MQPQLYCFIMCDEVRRAAGGKYSLVGVFYRVHAVSFPCLHSCHLVIGWYGKEGRHDFEINFSGPGGEELQKMPPYGFSLSPERPYSNVIIKAVLPLVKEGTYWFEVLLNGSMCGRFPLHVDFTASGYAQ